MYEQMFNRSVSIMLLTVLCAFNPGVSTDLTALPSQDMDYTQNVKAVFIYNFTKYMNWLDSEPSATFNIAVIGESEITEPLRLIAEKRHVDQRDIQVKRCERADQMNRCHILFIPESKKGQLNSIIDKIRYQNTLVISEIEGALSSGVMINFLLLENRIKFEINLGAMKKSGFQPSSELLKLAVRIIE